MRVVPLPLQVILAAGVTFTLTIVVPVCATYHAYDVANSPGPHGGGPFFMVMCMVLSMLGLCLTSTAAVFWSVGAARRTGSPVSSNHKRHGHRFLRSAVTGIVVGALVGCFVSIGIALLLGIRQTGNYSGSRSFALGLISVFVPPLAPAVAALLGMIVRLGLGIIKHRRTTPGAAWRH